MIPNHTFLFQCIYYCNINSITFSTLLHGITYSLMLELFKMKYMLNYTGFHVRFEIVFRNSIAIFSLRLWEYSKEDNFCDYVKIT